MTKMRGGEGWTEEDERKFHERRAIWNEEGILPARSGRSDSSGGEQIQFRLKEGGRMHIANRVRVSIARPGKVVVTLLSEEGYGIPLDVLLPGVLPPTPESIITKRPDLDKVSIGVSTEITIGKPCDFEMSDWIMCDMTIDRLVSGVPWPNFAVFTDVQADGITLSPFYDPQIGGVDRDASELGAPDGLDVKPQRCTHGVRVRGGYTGLVPRGMTAGEKFRISLAVSGLADPRPNWLDDLAADDAKRRAPLPEDAGSGDQD